MNLRHENGSSIVAWCLAIAVSTSIGALIFAIRNSFSSALLPAIYPVAGAALASVYFLFKITYVDAPIPRVLKTTAAILHERNSGALYSMSTIWTGEGYRAQSPLFTIDIESSNPKTRELLKADGTSPDRFTKIDLIESSIFSWLREVDQQFGFQSNGTIEGFSATGGSGGFDPKLNIDVQVTTEGKANSFLENGLLLRLPPGSQVIRRSPFKAGVREIEIKTPHSKLLFRFPTGGTGESLDKSASPTAQKVLRRMKLKGFEKTLWLDVFQIELTVSQPLGTRFSTQAVKELAWLNRIADSFVEKVSWKELKEKLANAPELPKP